MGHKIKFVGKRTAFCDCGLKYCQVPCLFGSKCVFNSKANTSEQQVQYHCSTCWDRAPEFGCCTFCAETCHQGHELIRNKSTIVQDVCMCGHSFHNPEKYSISGEEYHAFCHINHFYAYACY